MKRSVASSFMFISSMDSKTRNSTQDGFSPPTESIVSCK
jgi:hypothetical protein